MTADASPRYGKANPERVSSEVLHLAIRHAWSGHDVRKHLGLERDVRGPGRDFSPSSYREATPGPCWSWQRSGRTSTSLLDGRIVHVAGEHEDFHDADFCIYADVVVEHPEGQAEVFLYPKDVFPPTDFHSATLVGRDIVLIGSVGYADLRRLGETQVLKLDTDTLHIERLVTTGESPGWIAHHRARRISDTMIIVAGGTVQTPEGSTENAGIFALDLGTMTWSRDPHIAVSASAAERRMLEAIEIELALADERFPLEINSLKLVQFFERNVARNWTCIRPVAIAGTEGEVLLIEPRQTFSRGMRLAGIDFYEHLQTLAWRADQPR